jgi:branched-chain amino acid transport system substrate-binding protein
VKTPAESKYPWDYYKVIKKMNGEEAFGPLSTTCPLTKR